MSSKHQENLGLKMGTKEELFWIRVKEETEIEIQASKNSLLLSEEILKTAERKIKEAKNNAKKRKV